MSRADDAGGSRFSVTISLLAGLLLVGVMLMIHAGGLVSVPLSRAGVIWPVYLAFPVLGALALIGSRCWRAWPVWGCVLMWVLVGTCMPHALDVTPDRRAGSAEVLALAQCAALSIAALFLGACAGLRWWRTGWLAGLLLTGSIGVWELVTSQHLFVTAQRPWPFRGRVAAATFINPNNFGIVLLSMLVAVLAWRAVEKRALVRGALGFAALFAGAMAIASQSRAAALGVVLVVALEMARRAKAHPGVVRRAVSENRRLVGWGAAVLVAAVVAAFTVPPLADRNPVAVMIRDAMDPATARSDSLRVNLIKAALTYWRESGYLGSGAGSFEPRLWNDPRFADLGRVNLHNAFVELLSQYGVLAGLALAALLTGLLLVAWRTRTSAALRPQVAIVRTEMLGHLVAFAALGFTASSSLALPIWWLMLAAACACAARLVERTQVTSPIVA